MARRTKIVTINDEKSRDNGKSFLLTEMDADKGERWALRVLNVVLSSGISLPDGIADLQKGGGVAALAVALSSMLSTFKGLVFDKLDPLLTEMFECVEFIPDINKPNVTVKGPARNTQIEEISTRFILRKELFGLHVDFFSNGVS